MHFTLFRNIGIIIFIGIPLTDAKDSSSFQKIFESPNQGVAWNSAKHSHDYSNSNLQNEVRSSIDLLINDPNGFQNQINQLNQEQRKFITEDDLNSRTDPIDLLSVELKNRIEAKLSEEQIDLTIWSIDRSQLWSLAKYRLKTILDPSLKLESGFSVFRKNGLDNREVLFACVDSEKTKFDFSIADIRFEKKNFSEKTNPLKNWKCRNQNFQISWENVSPTLNSKEISALATNPLIQFKDRKEIHLVSSITLTNSISSSSLQITKKFLEWELGFKEKEFRENIPLKSRLLELLPNTDVFLPFSDIPNANQFQLSFRNTNASELILEKEINNPEQPDLKTKVYFHIFLPLLKDVKAEGTNGLSFSLNEMTNLLQQRLSKNSTQLTIFDLACFSKKYLSSWTLASRLTQSKNIPVLIASAEGHPAENPTQILIQMDFIIRGINQILSGGNLYAVQSELQKSSIKLDLMRMLLKPFHAFGFFKNLEIPKTFSPVSNLDESFKDLITSKNFWVLKLKTSSTEKIFPPGI